MKERGTITRNDIQKAEKILRDPQEFEGWIAFIKSTEPEFYTFLQETTSNIVAHLGQSAKLNYENMQMFGQSILTAFCCGFTLKYTQNQRKVGDILDSEKETEKFQRWLEGKMPSAFYQYSIDGLDKNSSVYQAKIKHEAILAEMKRERDAMASKDLFKQIEQEVTDDKEGITQFVDDADLSI